MSRVLRWVVIAASFLGGQLSLAQPYDLPEDRVRRSLLAEMRGDFEAGVPFDAEAGRICAKERRLRAYFDSGLDPSGHPRVTPNQFNDRGPGPTDPTDVLNNKLDIEVSPPGNALVGSNTMTVRSNIANLTTFTFRLRWNFTVTNCTITDGDPAGPYSVGPTVPVQGAMPASYGRTFTFARPIALGQVFTIKIDYNGNLQSGIGLGSVFYGGQNGNAANPGVVCTLSEPYYSGTWWPCKDGDLFVVGDNSDKATLTMSITAPEQFSSVSNGLLQGIDTATDPNPVVPPGKRRFRWATTYPMTTYLVFFSTSIYTTFNDVYDYGTGTMPVQFYIYPINDSPANRNAWLLSTQMLATYRPIFGLYPFINEKYGIYQFEFSGGEEHQTFTGQGQGVGAFNELITSHELGHQWWGDSLTCKTWSDIWLNEGFATYTEALWLERRPGSSGLPALKTAMNNRRPSDAASSVYCYDVANPGRIFDSRYSYRKAGWVLHMLRKVVGDATFFNILAAYRSAYEGGSPTTEQFIAVANAVSGQNLGWFFQPWIFEVGAPAYQYALQPAVIGGQNYARLMVKQVQTTGPTFDMPIDVSVLSTGNPTVLRSIRNNARTQYFLIPLDTAPTSVVLDPENWILEYGKLSVAYVAGPPKVVAAMPEPGASVNFAASPTTATILFSADVNITPAMITVTRAASPVPFTLSYAPTTQVATLTFTSALASGTYTVAISDAVTAGGIALDGELVSPTSSASLPSGDGLAGGISMFTFTVLPGLCPADFNGMDGVTVQDLFDFLSAYFAGAATADVNHFGGISVQDIFDYLSAYFTPCP